MVSTNSISHETCVHEKGLKGPKQGQSWSITPSTRDEGSLSIDQAAAINWIILVSEHNTFKWAIQILHKFLSQTFHLYFDEGKDIRWNVPRLESYYRYYQILKILHPVLSSLVNRYSKHPSWICGNSKTKCSEIPQALKNLVDFSF